MRIRKRLIVTIGSFLILISLIALIGTIVEIFPKSTNSCEKFKNRYPQSDCGTIISDKTSVEHLIVGKIKKVKGENGDNSLTLSFKNSHGKEYVQEVSLARKPIKLFLTELTSQDNITQDRPIDPSREISPSDLLKKYSSGDEIIISLQTPREEKIVEYKKNLGDLKELNCFQQNANLISYLKKSSFPSRLKLFIEMSISDCKPITNQIYDMR